MKQHSDCKRSMIIIIFYFHKLLFDKMLQNTIKQQFEQKQRQLFEMHMQLNGHSRNLFEEVLRKNNDIIKNCLQKFNEVYNRYEEYDSNFRHLNQQIGKINENNSNFHFEFRKTYLEAEKKQTQLTNDISMIKNALKIPSSDTPPEVYLQSDFFKSRVNRMRPRTKENKQPSHFRSRTNYLFTRKFNSKENQNINSDSWDFKQGKEQYDDERISACMESIEECNLREKSVETQIDRKSKTVVGGAQFQINTDHFLKKDYFQSKIEEMKQIFQAKLTIIENTKKECDWNHIDFDEFHRYIDEKITQLLSDKVSKSYMTHSLTNLKDAWEVEQKQIYKHLSEKATVIQVHDIQEKIQCLNEQLEMMKQGNGNRSNKIHLNHSVNKSCNFPFTSSRRNTFKEENSGQCSTENSPFLSKKFKNQDNGDDKKNQTFSNSLSTLSRGKGNYKHINVDNINDCILQNTSISDKVWKERVTEILGQGKVIKRSKLKQ